MANLYDTNATNNCYSPQEPDDISLFLQQILLRSSSLPSSSSHSLSRHPAPDHVTPTQILGQISPAEPSSVFTLCSTSAFVAPAADVSSYSGGNFDNETDDCDYESEEAVEALVAGTAAKGRCSTKRTRAAEVHNLSEKRRRSRINEKMKALQNLIPNSNKTDKASMLDEAIEYLKQLQLQVQMLTMRNGLSVYPVCMPGMQLQQQSDQVPQLRVDVYDTDNGNLMKNISTNHNISTDLLFRLPEKCVKQELVSEFPNMNGSNTSLEVEPSMLQHPLGAFQLSRSFKKKEKVLPCEASTDDRPQSTSAGARATYSIPCDTQTSNMKGDLLEGCGFGADNIQLLRNYANNH